MIVEETTPKITNRNIVVVALQPWDSDSGCNSKDLAVEFAKKNRVLYVNYALDRITRIRKRNTEIVKRRLDVIRGNKSDLISVQKNLWVFTPKVQVESINWIKSFRIFKYFNKRNNLKIATEIQSAIERLGFSDFILFNDNDIYRSFNLKEYLNPDIYIYYIRDYVIAVDYWRKHGSRMEAELCKKADVVLTNSTFLSNYAARYNTNSIYVGQGCDISVYNPDETGEIPSDVKKTSKPIIGYIGALKSLRLDIDLLFYLAATNPQWEFVFVGPEDEKFQDSPLHKLTNVKFLGHKVPELLPACIKSFDVCINPQIVNQVTIGNYPRKVDEYLAMGKPVVATNTPAMEIFKKHVYLANNLEDYVSLIARAFDENSEEKQMQRIEFASGHSWENNVREIYKAISFIENNKRAA